MLSTCKWISNIYWVIKARNEIIGAVLIGIANPDTKKTK